jgi:hypothetical protein
MPVLDPGLDAWCTDTLGARPAEVFFAKSSMSQVYGLRLDDGTRVVVKARRDPPGRAVSCTTVQRALHKGGFPCPEPLTDVDVVGGRTVHAERWVPGGDRLQGSGPQVAAAFAALLADLVSMALEVPVDPPMPAPIWAGWDHGGAALWPDDGVHLPDASHGRLPAFVIDTASRVSARLAGLALPCLVGHSDWETQNIRWRGGRPFMVHDWDSLAWRPEAAVAGLAAATFPSDRQPVLAPIDASARFLAEYQDARCLRFDEEELEVAWAAGLWLAAHNARMEVIYDKAPLIIGALAVQARERLRRAGA